MQNFISFPFPKRNKRFRANDSKICFCYLDIFMLARALPTKIVPRKLKSRYLIFFAFAFAFVRLQIDTVSSISYRSSKEFLFSTHQAASVDYHNHSQVENLSMCMYMVFAYVWNSNLLWAPQLTAWWRAYNSCYFSLPSHLRTRISLHQSRTEPLKPFVCILFVFVGVLEFSVRFNVHLKHLAIEVINNRLHNILFLCMKFMSTMKRKLWCDN